MFEFSAYEFGIKKDRVSTRWERIEHLRHRLGHVPKTEEERSCFLKRKFTYEQAGEEVRKMRLRGDDVRRYRCDFCGEFHIGHVPR